MYSRVFKNNQVTYGVPYQIKIPPGLQSNPDLDFEDGTDAAQTADSRLSGDSGDMLERTRRKCDSIIREAEQEAERILEKARREAEKKVGEIAEEAWQRGYAEGMDAAARQCRDMIAEAEKIRKSAAEEHESMLAGMEAEVVGLVMEVARKVVSAELSVNPDVVFHLAREALSGCSGKNGAVLRVSPADCEHISNNKDKFDSMVDGADNLVIKPDPTLKAGSCIVETALGGVDAGVAARLDKIEEAFREELEGR